MGSPAKPGQRQRYDYEYKRNGVRNLNLFFEPLTGRRSVKISERHTMQDFSHCMKWLVDELYPKAKVIQVVLDNLATHKPAALYAAFPPAEALRILNNLEFHYTPKHGSWLNMVEIEWSVYSRSLPKYIPNDEILLTDVQALIDERNKRQATVDWQFRTVDARIKLKQLYPSISMLLRTRRNIKIFNNQVRGQYWVYSRLNNLTREGIRPIGIFLKISGAWLYS
jgi:transposase